jgi:NIMA (never in mitosis gene a)-related kinase 2
MDKYETLEQVGKGSFGAVTKIKRKSDGKILVWKEISYGKMREKEKQQLVSEVNILRELRHPHIVKYYDRIVDKANAKIYIVMEYCEKGDLGQLIKKSKRENDFLPEDLIWKMFSQILLALQACHNREGGKILHRDIKPGNILLDSNLNTKIGDFGLSKMMGENSIYAETRVGTPYYMSPEQISDLRYNEKSDIWSAGCLLYEMVSLNPPFQAKSHAELASKISKGKVDRIPSRYSEDLQKVLDWMMALDYNLRPKVDEILNLPQVSLRLREKKLKDETQRIKEFEAKLKDRLEKANLVKNELYKKEKDILSREEICYNTKKIPNHPNRNEITLDCGDVINIEGKGRVLDKNCEYKDHFENNGVLKNHRDEFNQKLQKENSYEKIKQDKNFYKNPADGEKNENMSKDLYKPSANFIKIERNYENIKKIPERNDEVFVSDKENYYNLKNIPKVLKTEKSFENLVQEGLERIKRDETFLKAKENPKKVPDRVPKIPDPKLSPNPTQQKPEIPKSRISPTTHKNSPTLYTKSPNTQKIEKILDRDSPYLNQRPDKKDQNSTKKNDINLYQRNKSPPNPFYRKQSPLPSGITDKKDLYSDKKTSPYRYSPVLQSNEKQNLFNRPKENSPQYNNPTRYNQIPDKYHNQEYRRLSPDIRNQYLLRYEYPNLRHVVRYNSAERKVQSRNNIFSDQDSPQLNKDFSDLKPIQRPRTMETHNREYRKSPQNFEYLWNEYKDEEVKRNRYSVKPPLREIKNVYNY